LIKSPCKARFQVEGMSYTNIQVLNLGAHGCCVLIPTPVVNRFAAGPILDSWKLVHPKLPKGIIKAKVVWCRNQGKVNPGFLEAGVQFLDVPQRYGQELEQFLSKPVKQPGSDERLEGQPSNRLMPETP
jgi:hypothetical protein